MGFAQYYRSEGEQLGLKKGEQLGLKKGEQQGVMKGIPQGEALILRRQLTRRFGPLPEWAEAKLNEAGQEQLESWAMRILDASSLEEFFQ